MIHSLVAESRKLLRPTLLLLGLGAVALGAFLAVLNHEPTASSVRWAKQGLEKPQADALSPEDMGFSSDGPEYRAALREYRQAQEEGYRGVLRDAAIPGATQYPHGAAGLAASLSASMLGALLLFLAAGAHVAGEWSGRTIKEVLVCDGRLGRFVLVKVASVWGLGLALMGCYWIGIVLMGLVSRRFWPIPSRASSAEALAWAGPRVGQALLVLLLYASLGVLVSVLVRNPLGAFFGAALTYFALNMAARSDALERFVPVSWVGTVMGFTYRRFLIDHPLGPSGAFGLAASHAALAIAVLSGVLALAAWGVLARKRDVLESPA